MNSHANSEYLDDHVRSLHMSREELEITIKRLGIKIVCTAVPPPEIDLGDAVSGRDAACLRAHVTIWPG